jgi:HTH-type transcriptional regulator, transcriptional repressor of NAD biosynthesis genes
VTTRGFLLGKFLPPHQGHVFLGQFARHHCDELTILVCSLVRDPVPGALRFAWMRELFPDCRVIHLAEEVPQEPAEHPDFWPIWRKIVTAAHPEPIDYVFASEPYGAQLAAELGARFVPVDPPRTTVPVSGRDIIADPFAHWDFLPAPVRPYFTKSVCLFGPESTGKSMLARRLARRFDTIAVPEYARIYTDVFGTECPPEAFLAIAQGHLAATVAASRQARRILVLDTDPVLTAVWSDMLQGRRDPWFETAPAADLYLLTNIDVPWIDDGTRYFPDAGRRAEFFARCQAELDRRGLRYVTLSGDWEMRAAAAERAVLAAFPTLKTPADTATAP